MSPLKLMDKLPIEPITPADEAWLVQQCAQIDRMKADIAASGDAAEHPRHWPLMFLDLDDVLCINEHYGGLDALDALNGKRIDADLVWRQLWSPMAAQMMRDLAELLSGQLRVVITSTWRLHFTREQLREVFRRSGLACVAERMEPSSRWATPSMPTTTRCEEVQAWLCEHHRGEPWVVLDDNYSWSAPQRTDVPRTRVVLCEEWTGLQLRHWPKLVAALTSF